MIIPIGSIALLVAALFLPLGVALAFACAAALIGAGICTVHHAEVVALRVGERLGALVLALTMTIIEVSLILTIMSPGGPEQATLPRDTISAFYGALTADLLVIPVFRQRPRVAPYEQQTLSEPVP